MHLGQLTREACAAVAQNLKTVLERVERAARRLVENQGGLEFLHFLYHLPSLPAFARKKTDEVKAARREPGSGKRSNQRAGPRNGNDLDVSRQGFDDQLLARIANPRASGVGDQRAVLAARDPLREGLCPSTFVKSRQADQFAGDPIVLQQDPRIAGVFTGDERDLAQDLKRSLGDVREISDRRGHQKELA